MITQLVDKALSHSAVVLGVAGTALVAVLAVTLASPGAPPTTLNPSRSDIDQERDVTETTGQRRIGMSGSGPKMTEERLAAAPIVAVVRVTDEERVHWNNAANEEWKSEDMARPPMIYRDQQVELIRTARGTLQPVEWVRSVGGTVGETTFEFEGGSELEPGATHLLYLRWEDTPTQEGSERFLGVFGQEGGVFKQGAGQTWHNAATGVQVVESELIVR